MRKKIVFLSALIAILLLTGCENTKRVVCSQKVSTVYVDMIMDFKDDIIDSMGLKYKMDLSEYSDYQIDLIKSQNLCESVKQYMGTYSNAFTNCKTDMQGKELVITADFDIDKIPGAEDGKRDNIDDAIKQLESQGYKCQK